MASNVFSMLDDDDTTHEASTGLAAAGALSAAPDALPLSAPVMTPPRHGTSDDTRKREGMLEAKTTPSSVAAEFRIDAYRPSLFPCLFRTLFHFFVVAGTFHSHW